MRVSKRTTGIVLGLASVAGLGLLFYQLYQSQFNRHSVTVFSQTLIPDEHRLDDGGSVLDVQLDFDKIHTNVAETQTLGDTGIIPVLTVPATTPHGSFLLVLAVKNRRQGFTSFGQSDFLDDPKIFADHIQKVFNQRGRCKAIIEIDTHTDQVNSWERLLSQHQGLYVSPSLGQMVLPTNVNLVSCQTESF